MPDNEYDKIRKRECEWCAKGIPRYALGKGKAHYIPISHRVQMDHSCPADVPCTAPTELDFAEHQARIAEIRRVKLEHAGEALAKYRELVAGLDGRLNEACKMLCGEKEHLNA